MSIGGTATKRRSSEAINDAVRARVQRQETPKSETKFADIQSNPVFKVMMDPVATPQQKSETLAQTLSFTGTKTENRERVKAFEEFKEYLSHVREEMAKDVIKLTNTEAFSELQKVYGDLNNGLLDFEERMRPLTEILDAVYTLRTNGVTYDVFKEITEEKAQEEERQKRIQEIRDESEKAKTRIFEIRSEIRLQLENKSWFGLGGLKPEAESRIEQLRLEESEIDANLSKLADEVKALQESRQAEGEFAAEKAKLRELLDITSDEHRDRQKALVQAALNFVENSKERVGAVREHLDGMSSQVDTLFDNTGQMSLIYASMNEGIKKASQKTLDLQKDLSAAPENEDAISKIQREQKKMDVEQHLKLLDNSARDTLVTAGDLTGQTVRIKTMKDANEAQVDKARTVHTQGIAGVADRLSVVLQAVSAAALGESSAMAADTINRMHDSTNSVAQKEVIRVATGIDEVNQNVIKALDDLGAYGEVMRTATEIQRKGLAEMRSNLEELQRVAAETAESVQDSISVNADVASGASTEKVKTQATPSPFSF